MILFCFLFCFVFYFVLFSVLSVSLDCCFFYAPLCLSAIYQYFHDIHHDTMPIILTFNVDHHYHHDLVIMIIITIIIKRVVIISISSTKSPASTSQPGMDSRELLRFNVGCMSFDADVLVLMFLRWLLMQLMLVLLFMLLMLLMLIMMSLLLLLMISLMLSESGPLPSGSEP